jgi:TolB-like protein
MIDSRRADLKSWASPSQVALGAIWLVAALLAAGGTGLAADTSAGTSRLTVAILFFESQTTDPAVAHWRYTIARLLAGQLDEAKALRQVPAAFGYRQLNLKRGDPISAEQARKIGELIEARRVVWGSYRREGSQWFVTARVLNVASGKAGKELKAVSADWYDVRDHLADQITKELGVKPGNTEHQRMRRRGTTVPLALEWFSQAYAGEEERKPRAD